MADRTSVFFDIEFKKNDKRTRILRDIDSFDISTVKTKKQQESHSAVKKAQKKTEISHKEHRPSCVKPEIKR